MTPLSGKMLRFVKIVLFTAIIWLISTEAIYGQQLKLVSAGVSANAYRGDLNSRLEKWSNIFHLGFRFNPSKKLNGSANLGIGFITGENFNYIFESTNIPTPNPNRFFRTNVTTVNYELNYNFLEWKNFTFFISQGIGLLRFNPKDEFFDDFQDQPDTRAPNETFANITLMLPTQLGFLYLFPNDFGLNFQVGLMNSFTDYLDNISDWGNKDGGDNIVSMRFSFLVPIYGSSQ